MKMLQESLALETIARITEYSISEWEGFANEQLQAMQAQINSADR
ncbi:hypothetical protein ACN4EG_27105 [Alkalinema pantanalense CENA528]